MLEIWTAGRGQREKIDFTLNQRWIDESPLHNKLVFVVYNCNRLLTAGIKPARKAAGKLHASVVESRSFVLGGPL